MPDVTPQLVLPAECCSLGFCIPREDHGELGKSVIGGAVLPLTCLQSPPLSPPVPTNGTTWEQGVTALNKAGVRAQIHAYSQKSPQTSQSSLGTQRDGFRVPSCSPGWWIHERRVQGLKRSAREQICAAQTHVVRGSVEMSHALMGHMLMTGVLAAWA